MPDYSKCYIYKLCCKDPNITDIYVGSTCNYIRRKHVHKNNTNNVKSKDYYLSLYKFVRKNYGFDNWSLIVLHSFSCDNKLEKEMIEREWIEKLKPSLNKCIPTRTKKEYCETNKNILNEKSKNYYVKNKDKINEKIKEKINCNTCNKLITKKSLLRHEKTFHSIL